MRTVVLGKTGIITPKNAFGALPVQRVDDDYAVMLLRKAYNAGFTFFDTARSYSDSEHKIGLALSDVREKIYIASKSGAKDGESLKKDLEKSLSELKTDYIDLYQLHNIPFVPRENDGSGLYEALLWAKEQGKIRHIGITNHRPNVALEAVNSGLYETLQFPFCYLASDMDVKLVELCAEKNVGFIAMKGLSGGLITRADAAYAYMAQFENVLPIWGIQRECELDEFCGFFENEPQMTEQMALFIEKERKELCTSFCRGCGYCMPCPMGIEINNCARMSQLIRRSPSEYWLLEKSQKMMKNIENCQNCGHCSSLCPYGLDTPDLLRRNLEDYDNILAGKVKI